MLVLDHLAVACGALDEGREAVEAALGVPLQVGGKHAHFGTQNMLLRLEDGLYLEIIAIDPLVEPEQKPRWFDLDRFSGAPRLSNWICATQDLDEAIAVAPVGIGGPIALQRGNLEWKMAVPDSGILPFDNCFPALIEWGGDRRNPSYRLTPQRCSLMRLVIGHPDATELESSLAGLLEDGRIVFEKAQKPELMAEFKTPNGLRVLR